MRILPPLLRVVLQCQLPVVFVVLEDTAEDRAVLKASIHTLAVEGDHRVRCVAQQQKTILEVVRTALLFAEDRHKGKVHVRFGLVKYLRIYVLIKSRVGGLSNSIFAST